MQLENILFFFTIFFSLCINQIHATETNINSFFLKISKYDLYNIFEFLNFKEVQIFTNHLCHDFQKFMTKKFDFRSHLNVFCIEFLPFQQNGSSKNVITLPRHILKSIFIFDLPLQKYTIKIFLFENNKLRIEVDGTKFNVQESFCQMVWLANFAPHEFNCLIKKENWIQNIENIFCLDDETITFVLQNNVLVNFLPHILCQNLPLTNQPLVFFYFNKGKV